MCECKKNIEKKLNDRFTEQYPDAKDHSATLTGYTLLIEDDSLRQAGYMELKATALHPIKKGGEKLRTIKQNMIFSYCPFCGEKYAA